MLKLYFKIFRIVMSILLTPKTYFKIFKIVVAILLMLAFAVCACCAFFIACSGESYDYGPDSEDSMTITDTSDPVFDPMEENP